MQMLVKALALLMTMVLLGACANTESSSVKNPAYSNFKLTSPAIVVVDGGLDLGLKVEAELIKQLNKNGVNARGITGDIQFLETAKEWQQFSSSLYDEGVKEIVFVSTIENTNLSTFSYKTNTTHNPGVSVNGVNYVNPSSTSTTTPLITIKKSMYMSMKIDEFGTAKSVWKGNAINNSQGTLYTGEQPMISNTIEEMIKALKKDSLLQKTTYNYNQSVLRGAFL